MDGLIKFYIKYVDDTLVLAKVEGVGEMACYSCLRGWRAYVGGVVVWVACLRGSVGGVLAW